MRKEESYDRKDVKRDSIWRMASSRSFWASTRVTIHENVHQFIRYAWMIWDRVLSTIPFCKQSFWKSFESIEKLGEIRGNWRSTIIFRYFATSVSIAVLEIIQQSHHNSCSATGLDSTIKRGCKQFIQSS